VLRRTLLPFVPFLPPVRPAVNSFFSKRWFFDRSSPMVLRKSLVLVVVVFKDFAYLPEPFFPIPCPQMVVARFACLNLSLFWWLPRKPSVIPSPPDPPHRHNYSGPDGGGQPNSGCGLLTLKPPRCLTKRALRLFWVYQDFFFHGQLKSAFNPNVGFPPW